MRCARVSDIGRTACSAALSAFTSLGSYGPPGAKVRNAPLCEWSTPSRETQDRHKCGCFTSGGEASRRHTLRGSMGSATVGNVVLSLPWSHSNSEYRRHTQKLHSPLAAPPPPPAPVASPEAFVGVLGSTGSPKRAATRRTAGSVCGCGADHGRASGSAWHTICSRTRVAGGSATTCSATRTVSNTCDASAGVGGGTDDRLSRLPDRWMARGRGVRLEPAAAPPLPEPSSSSISLNAVAALRDRA